MERLFELISAIADAYERTDQHRYPVLYEQRAAVRQLVLGGSLFVGWVIVFLAVSNLITTAESNSILHPILGAVRPYLAVGVTGWFAVSALVLLHGCWRAAKAHSVAH